jgi:type I restriction enzyme S subunit
MRSDNQVHWRVRALGDVCSRITSGGTPARSRADRYYVNHGHSWIKTKELHDQQIWDTEEHITDAALAESAANLLPPKTVLVAMYGATVGQLGVLAVPAACNQACCALLVDQEKADYRFVFYALLHHRSRLIRAASGAAQQNINTRIIRAFEFPFPPLSEQRRLALLLRALDDKIDSNRRLAASLEETAAGIFKARFVDFVGVEEFEESEIGLIPKGWQAGDLNSLARFINGKAFTKQANARGRPILRIRELNSGIDDSTPRSDTDAGNDHVTSGDDILFAWSGSLAAYRWSGPESLINQHIFKVIPESWPSWFVYHWVQEHMPEFRSIAQDTATTMGHIQRRHLAEAKVPLPATNVIASADAVLGSMDTLRAMLVEEKRTLIQLRDTLLPKLISGEIRVPDTKNPEEVIGPAAKQLAVAAK